ncbi:hypothetical protein [Streptomyces sp. RKAG337]|uniref:hypothetical protein n=1 Tax=Streptomyces sp. RKAG337 TaxID=2893404 RepID=UPI002033AC88|nr:hypothetical protein [Streptomyces sp. RKAG337]MCM2430906.1 hypothetical protein [Streptomyces sp. RKAG337]
MHAITATNLEAIEEAAQRASLGRANGSDIGGDRTPDPSVLGAGSERDGVARVLRHRLRLDEGTALSVYEDANHPLFPGAQLFRAARVQLSHGRRSYFFIAAYEAWAARLTFSLIAPCYACQSPVPTVAIDTLADFGDWLNSSRDLTEAPQFRTSPVHRGSCPVRDN